MNYLFIDTEYEDFINEIKLLEPNKRRLKKLKERYNDQIYLMSGLKCADPSKLPGTPNQQFIEEKKLEQIAKLEPLEREIKRLAVDIKRTQLMLNDLDEDYRNMLIDLYINGKTLNSVGTERNIGEPYKVTRELKKLYNGKKKGYDL